MPDTELDPAGPVSRPTMRDVAALAGVSFKTVSRVVNGVSTVDPALAARVREAAARLGYRPNLTASNLRRSDGRTATIGVLVSDAGNPFSASLMRTIEDVARRHRVLVLFGSLDENPAQERELAEALINRRVDGLLIMPAGRDHGYLLKEREAGTCMVFIDREPRYLDADAVVSDNRGGAIAGVNHLISGGHRRIAYLGDQLSIATGTERLGGYLHALELARIAVDDRLVWHESSSEEAAITAVTRMLRMPDPPTALFTGQNFVTIGAARALRSLGLQDEVAMVGFDDFPLADLLRPGISVIEQDTAALGRIAAETLFRRLDGDRSATVRHMVHTRLIRRGSGEIPAAAQGD